MIKTLQIDPSAIAASSLIKAVDVVRSQEAADIMRDARNRAQEIIQTAERDAIHLRSAAFATGLEQGVAASLTPSLDLIARLNAIEHQLVRQADECLRQCFSQVVERPEILDAMLNPLLALARNEKVCDITVGVPRNVKVDRTAIQQRASVLGLKLRFVHVEMQDFHIEWLGHRFHADFAGFDRSLSLPDSHVAFKSGEARNALCASLRNAADHLDSEAPSDRITQPE